MTSITFYKIFNTELTNLLIFFRRFIPFVTFIALYKIHNTNLTNLLVCFRRFFPFMKFITLYKIRNSNLTNLLIFLRGFFPFTTNSTSLLTFIGMFWLTWWHYIEEFVAEKKNWTSFFYCNYPCIKICATGRTYCTALCIMHEMKAWNILDQYHTFRKNKLGKF